MLPLPSDFLQLMQQQWGTDQAAALAEALQTTDPSVSVRLNPSKWDASTMPLWEGAEVVPWCQDGHYLPQRPPFTFDPLLHGGAYYVQEASSMFLAQALSQHAPQQPLVALDLCAAPGGKSTLLRSCLHPQSLLVSNEPMRQRAQVLAENITKWGHPRCVVTQNYPSDFTHLRHTFDLIVADVPCSGEGMFRKDDDAIRDWSLQNVDTCWRRQRSIIADIWPTLKPGGLLVYSTCTFNTLEDEDNVRWICSELGAIPLPITTSPQWGITGHYHFLPGRTRGEGFFLACLRKDASEPLSPFTPRASKKEKNKKQLPKDDTPLDARQWLKDPEPYTFLVHDDQYVAIPADHAPLMAQLRTDLHLLTEGITLAERKGHDWAPAHALALSTALSPAAFPTADLTLDAALAYLRREAIQVDAPRGYVLVTHRGLPLGFVKNLGTRANNLYPAEWRIRSTHVPV